MTDWPVHGEIDRPDRHDRLRLDRPRHAAPDRAAFAFDREPLRRHRPDDKDRGAARRARHPLHPGGGDPRQLPRPPDAAPHRWRRAGLLRQPVRRHLLARHHGALPRARRALHRHRRRALGRLLLRQERRAGGAHELRAARDSAGGAAKSPGGATAVSCCGANPGMVSWFVKQALLDLARDTGRSSARSRRPAKTGRGSMQRPRRQGHPHRRARHAARQATRSRMDVFVNTWSVEGFLSEGVQPAELGWGTHETLDAGECRHATRRAARPRSTCCSPAPTRASAPGARRPARNTASWSPTTRRSRSPTTSPCARAARPSTARPATTPTTLQRCRAVAARDVRPRRQCPGDAPHPRRARDRRRHRRARRAALRPCAGTPTGTARSSRSRRRASSRPTRTPPASR